MEQKQDWEQVAELLLKNGYNPQLMRIFLKLKDCQKSERSSKHKITKKVYINICNRILRIAVDELKDDETISKVITSLFLTRKDYADNVLQIIENLIILPPVNPIFVRGEHKDFISVYNKMRGIQSVKNNDFTNGLILGLFDFANKSNIRGGGIPGFDKKLIPLLFKIIIHNTLTEYSYYPDFEKKLGKSIKTFGRPVNDVGQRLALIHQLYLELEQYITDHTYDLNCLANLLLDQLNYAILGTISEKGRAIAVRQVFKHLLDFPQNSKQKADQSAAMFGDKTDEILTDMFGEDGAQELLDHLATEEVDLPESGLDFGPQFGDLPPEEETLFDLADELDREGDLFGNENYEFPFDLETVLAQTHGESAAEYIAEHDAATHYDLGIAYKEMGLYDEAIQEFLYAARDQKRKPDSLLMIGYCLTDVKAFSKGIEICHIVIELAEQNPHALAAAYCAAASAYMELNQLSHAKYMTLRSMEANHGFKPAEQLLAQLKDVEAEKPII
ncbi:hypothetical protein ACFL2U_01515 [Patescibacteria group bacterium]